MRLCVHGALGVVFGRLNFLLTMGKKGDGGDREEAPAEIPLARYLASTEKPVRDRAIRSLAKYIAECTGDEGLNLAPLELAKLWKGIFYCFWMSDKPLVQQALAQELADLVLTIAGLGDDEKRSAPDARAYSALAFYAGFWGTIEREWLGIDKFRVNKYYMLMRRFVCVGLRLLHAYSWHAALVERFCDILTRPGGPLTANDVHVPDSVAYHISDVFLDELDRVAAAGGDARVPAIALLTPFIQLVAKSSSHTMYDRVMGAVLEPFIDECARIEDAAAAHKRRRVEVETRFPSLLGAMADADGEATTLAGRVRHRLLYTVFVVAGGQDTYAPHRRRLYALWQAEADEEDEDEE